MKMSKTFWNERWSEGLTKWDIGHPSPPLIEYMDQVQQADCEVLIPGCGNAYEAEYLWKKGFHSVHILDWSPIALDHFAKRLPDFPKNQLHCEDFFEHAGKYDLVMEQTFFCALEPDLRKTYVQKMDALLKDGGKLFGLLFDFPLETEGPPFGGSESEYRKLLEKTFDLKVLARAKNSIKPRLGKEFFFLAEKRLQDSPL